MKKNLLILFTFLLAATVMHADWINSVTFLPSNPTSTDNIKVLVECSFSSGPCDPSPTQQSISTIGSDVYANATHCLGMLSVICPYTDTFVVGSLPAGSYNFHMQLNSGSFPAPCSPGIAPGPDTTVAFIVSLASGTLPSPVTRNFAVYPDASSFDIILEIPSGKISDENIFQLYSVDGKLVLQTQITEEVTRIKNHCRAGLYFGAFRSGTDTEVRKIFLVR